MSGRDNPSGDPKKPTYRPLTGRMTAMGSSGWEAYTVGFTLVGCIVAGAGLGLLLDNRFKTSFWLPVLFLFGVAAGFREMFLTLKRVEAERKRKQAETEAKQTSYTPPPANQPAAIEPTIERERIFKVPSALDFGKTPEVEPDKEGEEVDDLIQRLLNQSDEKPDELDRKSESDGSDRKD